MEVQYLKHINLPLITKDESFQKLAKNTNVNDSFSCIHKKDTFITQVKRNKLIPLSNDQFKIINCNSKRNSLPLSVISTPVSLSITPTVSDSSFKNLHVITRRISDNDDFVDSDLHTHPLSRIHHNKRKSHYIIHPPISPNTLVPMSPKIKNAIFSNTCDLKNNKNIQYIISPDNNSDNSDISEYIANNPILTNIGSNASIVIYDKITKTYSEVEGSIKDKINVTVISSLNKPIGLIKEGKLVQLKNYLIKIVMTNPIKPVLIIIPQTTFERESQIWNI